MLVVCTPQARLARRQVENILVFIRQVAHVPACWLLRHQQQVDLWPFDLESGIRVMCEVGYLSDNLSSYRLFVPDLGPMYARETDRRQINARQKRRLMPPPLWGRRHNKLRPTLSNWEVSGSYQSCPKCVQLLLHITKLHAYITAVDLPVKLEQ